MTATSDIIERRSPLTATSWDADARTLEVVFSTGAAVDRYDQRGAFTETLDLNQDWSRFRGAPVLNSHRRGDLGDVLGSVQKAWTVGGNQEARAVLKLSRRPDVEPIVQDILDGHIRGVSFGYTVQAWKETTDGNGRRVKTATKLTPVELSLVSVPADPSATIREAEMTANTTTPAVVPDTTNAAAERAAINVEIRSIARTAQLDQRWTDTQIDAGATTEQARASAFEAMRVRSAAADTVRNTTTVTVGEDATDPEVRARTIGEALYTRVTPSHKPSDAARAYVGLTIPEIARDCLRTRSIATTGLSASSVIERALHSTSDFPVILGDTVGRTLRQAYGAAPVGVRRLGRQTTAKDFRSKYRIMLSAAPTLEKVGEHGEFKSGTLGEAKESYKIDTFGRIIGITRQALVNDDLGAFSDIPRRMGQAAAAFEADFLVDLLTTGSGLGPVMDDTKRLFHADHGNLAGSGGAIGESTLSAARLAMRSQVGLASELISVTPKFVLVSATKETEAEKAISEIQATIVDDVNPFSALSLVVEPRLSGNPWYVVADAGEIDGLEFAYLEGEPGPQIETRAGFEVDGVQVKVRLDFGAGFVDHRGWYRNPGA